MTATPESVIQSAILLALGSRPDVRLWRANVMTGRSLATGRVYTAGIAGQADLTGFIRPEGWRLEVEVKSAAGRQRPDQITYQRVIDDGGGCYVLARSVDEAIDQVDAFIARKRRATSAPITRSSP
jgi:hypothetical protein